jgi:predicted nucleic acid-binding protein
MRPTEIAAGERIGLDANVFVYHFCGSSAQATNLLERVERAEVSAATTQEVLFEVMHRLMAAEASAAGLIAGSNPLRSLKRRPEIVRGLHEYYRDTMAIAAIGVEVLAPLPNPLRASQRYREQFGLLTRDSVLAATLEDHGIRKLVTADRDFMRVSGIKTCLLTDVNAGP